MHSRELRPLNLRPRERRRKNLDGTSKEQDEATWTKLTNTCWESNARPPPEIDDATCNVKHGW